MDVGISALTQKQAISNCRAPGEAVVTNAARKCRDELQRRGKELQKGKENALRYETTTSQTTKKAQTKRPVRKELVYAQICLEQTGKEVDL